MQNVKKYISNAVAAQQKYSDRTMRKRARILWEQVERNVAFDIDTCWAVPAENKERMKEVIFGRIAPDSRARRGCAKMGPD